MVGGLRLITACTRARFRKKKEKRGKKKEKKNKRRKRGGEGGGKFYDYTRLYCPREPGHQPCLLIAIVYDFHSKRYASVSSRITRPPSPHARIFSQIQIRALN